MHLLAPWSQFLQVLRSCLLSPEYQQKQLLSSESQGLEAEYRVLVDVALLIDS